MTRHRCVLFLLLVTSWPVNNKSWLLQDRSKHETWYERARHSVNPDNIDFGSIWAQRKRAFMDQLGNPYFQFGLGATVTIVVLLIAIFTQHVSHRRALELAVDSITDIRRHDEYSRETAREAIRRYNDHIESCNRVIEARESGLWKWTSSAELEAMNRKMQRLTDDLTDAREEVKRVTDELEEKSSIIAEMSLRAAAATQKSAQPSKGPVPAPHVERINQLELELNAEKKKNQRVKGTALDVRNS